MKHSTRKTLSGPSFGGSLCAVLIFLAIAPHVRPSEWRAGRTVEGVALESRNRDSRFLEHRGAVTLCGDLSDVLEFVSEPRELVNWVPYTAAAERLPETDGRVVYHVVTRAPWPYKPRDMVYALDVDFSGDQASVHMNGLPGYIPPRDGLVRMQAADGVWTFVGHDKKIAVSLQMWVDPGSGPALLVNRRAANTVGRMLANLRDRYMCKKQAPV